MNKLALFILLLPIAASSQTRNECWLKMTVNRPLDEQWSVGVELQHRRQANFQIQDKNIFHYPLANYARAWITYKLPHKWALVLSPVGYFDNEDIISSYGELKQTNELRISPGVIRIIELGRIRNKNRLLYDARFADFNKSDHFFQSRFRMQTSFSFPVFLLKKENKISYQLSDEILIKKEKTATGFDQNRLYNAIQWENHGLDIDIGYQWIVQKNKGAAFNRNQLFIVLNIII